MDQFASALCYQKSVTVLLVVWNLAERNNAGGGIEDQQMSQLRMFIQRRERRLITAFRQLDGKYDVVESHVRRAVLHGNAAIGVNRHVVGFPSDLRQHGG